MGIWIPIKLRPDSFRLFLSHVLLVILLIVLSGLPHQESWDSLDSTKQTEELALVKGQAVSMDIPGLTGYLHSIDIPILTRGKNAELELTIKNRAGKLLAQSSATLEVGADPTVKKLVRFIFQPVVNLDEDLRLYLVGSTEDAETAPRAFLLTAEKPNTLDQLDMSLNFSKPYYQLFLDAVRTNKSWGAAVALLLLLEIGLLAHLLSFFLGRVGLLSQPKIS